KAVQRQQRALLRSRIEMAIGLQSGSKPNGFFQDIQRENLSPQARLPYSSDE
ncbi:MAG: hypothetical protein RL585_2267, partial [Pseudomonadota bacterium]